jgi:Schlafen, AlbA_2
MWMPSSYEEIERAIKAGNLQETEIFDAKREVPKQKPNKELAKDIVAMANDGGVLLYGIDEDENDQPIRSAPITLAGESERVAQVAATLIAEPLTPIIREFPDPQNPAVGYLMVAVPPSPRAPHMVLGGDYRYYRRVGKTSQPMPHGEVERLRDRRRRWERDIDEKIEETVFKLRYSDNPLYGYLYLLAWPVISDSGLLQRACGEDNLATLLNDVTQRAIQGLTLTHHLYPDLKPFVQWQQLEPGGYRAYMAENPRENPDRKPLRILDVQINSNGSAWLVFGRATEYQDDERGRVFYEDEVAGLTARFVKMLSELYERGNYLGQVDLGVRITNLAGASSEKVHSWISYENPPALEIQSYQHSSSHTAPELSADPINVARSLVGGLIEVVTQERYDPFVPGQPRSY